VSEREYITFGCFRLDIQTTFQYHTIENLINIPFNLPEEDPGENGMNVWWNHPKYAPNMFHWCSAITTDNMIKLNGMDESFSFGYGREDGYFLHQVKTLGLNVKITENPFVVHQWHSHRQYSENISDLILRNEIVNERLMMKNEYRAKHILTPDFVKIEPCGI
jgi:hypothetical protein